MMISEIIVHFSQVRDIDIERRAEMKIKELLTTVAELEAKLFEKPKMDVNGIDKDQ